MKQLSKSKIQLSVVAALVTAAIIFSISSIAVEPSHDRFADIKPMLYHFTIFFFLSFFLLLSTVQHTKLKFFIPSFIISALYAASDEFHQHFVPGRDASIFDVGTDVLGIGTATAIYAIFLLKTYERK